MKYWLAALGATMLMQLVASFMGQSLPVIAPLMMASTGLAPERVGNLSSLTALATVLYLMIGGVFLARMGPVRMLQLGTAMAVTALLVASLGHPWAIFLAAFMLGLGYGPTPPAGSRMLAATAPPAHRSLIFSIKQAGAPAGGALAGLIAAPVALAYGWPAALMLAFGVGVIAILVIQPLRPAFDAERNRAQRLRFSDIFSPRAISAPLATFKQNPVLRRVTALSVSFAICQGCLFSFTVTWLVEKRGFDLVLAGSVFAAMQFAGVVARILQGWVADRTGNALANLVAQGFVAGSAILALALLPADAGFWPLAFICALTGFFGASWNGISLAEVARLAPHGKVADATAGSTIFVFLGYVAGPSIFATLVSLTGSWMLPQILVAAQLLLVSALVGLTLRKPRQGGAFP
jgi:MFS family permease